MSDLANIERHVRGMYFEDFEVGMILVTPSRTITHTDIVNFCCLTGDFNGVHSISNMPRPLNLVTSLPMAPWSMGFQVGCSMPAH